jgi:Phosphotransferase enzyme family
LDLPVEREVFGCAQPEELADAVDAWCRAHLGAPIERYEVFE